MQDEVVMEQARGSGVVEIPVVLSQHDPLVPLLRTLAAEARPALALTLHDDMESALAATSKGPILVPMKPPVDALAQLLDEGWKASDALHAWKQRTDAFLRASRRARRRLVMIAPGPLTQRAAESLDVLEARLGVRFARDAYMAPGPDRHETQHGPSVIFAAALLDVDAPARALADELRAMYSGPGGESRPPSRDISAIWSRLTGGERERQLLAEKLSQAEGERDRLRAELEAVSTQIEIERLSHAEKLSKTEAERDRLRVELEAVSTRVEIERLSHAEKLSQAEGERNRLRTELQEVSTQIGTERQAHEAKLARVEGEQDQLRAEFEAVAAQAETQRQSHAEALAQAERRQLHHDAVAGALALRDAAEKRALQHECAEKNRQIAALEAELGRVYASRSWKVTRPVRGIGARLRRGRP
ncbi:MAG: hypothetical protein JJT95_18355 [Pararhodobacter sp.]|nr:hypothetical protein [Pararhodobacter sp.]